MRRILSVLFAAAAVLCAQASNPHTPISQADVNARYQRLPAVQQGKVLVKQPETNVVPFGASFASPLEAYLGGYGPMTPEVRCAIAGHPVIQAQDANWLNRQRVYALEEGEAEVMVTPRAIVKNWDREDLFLYPISTDMFNPYTDGLCFDRFMVYDFDEEGEGY